MWDKNQKYLKEHDGQYPTYDLHSESKFAEQIRTLLRF